MPCFHDAFRACCLGWFLFQCTGEILKCASMAHDLLGEGKERRAVAYYMQFGRSQEEKECGK